MLTETTSPAVIAISVSDIADRILAATAMRHLLDGARPPLLHADHREGLAQIIRSSFAEICLRLAHHAADCELTDIDILSVTLRLPPAAAPALLRGIIERALTAASLAEAYRGADAELSALYRSDNDSLMTALLRSLDDATIADTPPSIRPHIY